jgi:tagaturonate epimerase
METAVLRDELLSNKNVDNTFLYKKLLDNSEISIYPRSIQLYEKILFFIGREKISKYLFILFEDINNPVASEFDGTMLVMESKSGVLLKKCEMNNHNRVLIQKYFAFTNPAVIGLSNSFGFGDRLGLANAGHIRSLNGSSFKPILAQQSIRELTRTNRTPDEVMDAAVWAVFQEGYRNGFGADADHLKTTDDIDLMVKAGFKMFTFDPGEYVKNEADALSEMELDEKIKLLNWEGLASVYEELSNQYLNKEIVFSDALKLIPSESDLKRALLKYGNALAHIKRLYDYLKSTYSDYDSEVEVSVDETESVTSPFEHYFIANELIRMNIKFISLAPRFVGEFEKGIDYRGDINLFKEEYIKHLSIVKYFGSYKISLHSGSDKFSVYKVIGSMSNAFTHVKTAGTSYLEALKVTAVKEPALFREILDYSRSLYENEKKTYHVSADLKMVKPANEYNDEQLLELFYSDDCRQILHVTFGRIVTDKDENGKLKFKERLLNCLKENEETHYNILIKHFKKHLEPFN